MITKRLLSYLVVCNIMLQNVGDKVEDIILTDPGELARRAAVLLYTILHQKKMCSSLNIQTMVNAMTDSDWEVKLHVLEFWTIYIQNLIDIEEKDKESAVEGHWLKEFCITGGAEGLMLAVHDTDKAVQTKAIQLANLIYTTVENYQTLFGCKRMKMSADYFNEMSQIEKSDDKANMKDNHSVLSFISILNDIEFKNLLKQSNESSDQHMSNPCTLLQDILISMTPKNSIQENEDSSTCALAVDCY